MRWWFSCGWLVRVWKKRRRRHPARRGIKLFRPQLEVLEERRLFAGNVWLPTQLAAFDGTSQTNLAMPIFQPGATTFLPQLGLQATSISATGSVSLTANGSYQLDLTQSGAYDDKGDDYTFAETGPVQFSLVEQGNLSATGFSITSITLTQTATLSWSLVETNSSGLTVQNLSGVDTVTPTSSGAAPFDPFFWQGFNWQSLTQQISSLNTLGLSSLAADSLSVTETDGSEGYTFQETNGVATVSGSVQQPLSDSLLESGQDSYSETAVEQLDSTLTGSDSFSLTELGCYGSGSYALSSVSYQETGTQSRQFNATVVDSRNGNGAESGAQSFSGSNNSLGYSSSDSFVFNDVSTLSYGETASSNYTLTQSGSFGSGSFSLDCLSYNANGSGGYSLTQTSLQTQDGSFSDSDNASGADSYGVAGTLSDSGTSTDAGNFTTTSGGTLQDNESGNFTLSEGGAYGNGSWALSSYSYSDSLSGSFSQQELGTTTQSGNSTVTSSGTGTDSFLLNYAGVVNTSGGATFNSTDTSIDSFTETSTSSSTQSGTSTTTLSEQGTYQNGSVSLSSYVFTAGQSGTYTASGTDNETDNGSALDTASGSDSGNQSSILDGVSTNLLGSDTFTGSDSFSFTSIDSISTTDSGTFGESAYQAGVFNNGSFALSSVSDNSTQSDNWSANGFDTNTDSGTYNYGDGSNGTSNVTVVLGGTTLSALNGGNYSEYGNGTFSDTCTDSFNSAGSSQLTYSDQGSFANYSFSFNTVMEQANGTSNGTVQESDYGSFTGSYQDSYLDSANATANGSYAVSTAEGSATGNDNGSDSISVSGPDTVTETVTSNDSWSLYAQGSFVGGSWSLSSVASGESYNDSFSLTQTDSATISGTDTFYATGTATASGTSVYGGGSFSGAGTVGALDSGTDSISGQSNDTITETGDDSFLLTEQGSFSNFSFAFNSVVYQGGDSVNDTVVESSSATSSGTDTGNYSVQGQANGAGTYASNTESNNASGYASGNYSFQTGGTESVTETVNSSESDSFYDAGVWSGGSLSLSVASFTSSGRDTWSFQGLSTSTASGSIGQSDSGSAGAQVQDLSGTTGSDTFLFNDADGLMGTEVATATDSYSGGGSDSWGQTEQGSYGNFSYSFTSLVYHDGGSESATDYETATDSFSGAATINSSDNSTSNRGGQYGLLSLSVQANGGSSANGSFSVFLSGQSNATMTSSDTWSDYEAGSFSGNSLSLISVNLGATGSDSVEEHGNATIAVSGPETFSGGVTVATSGGVNNVGGVTATNAETVTSSGTLSGTDTVLANDSYNDSGSDTWNVSEQGVYGNYSYSFGTVVVQGGGSSGGCMQQTATGTFVGASSNSGGANGQQTGSDNQNQDSSNDSSQASNNGSLTDTEAIYSQDTITGGNSDTWSLYELGSYAGSSYAFSSINYQDNGSDSTTETSLATSYGTLSGSGSASESGSDGLEDSFFVVAVNGSSSGSAYGSITGNDAASSSATIQQGDSWSLTELGSYSNASISLSCYAYSSSDSNSVNVQETDSITETATATVFQSDASYEGNMASVQGTWTMSGTLPISGTFAAGVDNNRDNSDSGFASETTSITETTTDTELETFNDAQSQVGVYAAGSFNLTTVTYDESSSDSTTETSTDSYLSSETSQGNSSLSDGQLGYGSDGYGIGGLATVSGQQTISGGDTATDQSQLSQTLYQAGSFSNDSYSLSSYAYSASGSDTAAASSSDTFTSLSSGSDSGNETIDGWSVYLGSGTFTATGSGSDGSADTQNASWGLTELGNVSGGSLALSCYSLSEQENSSASSNDNSGWTETLSGTNQSDSFSGTASGTQNDSDSSSNAGSLLEQGTATGDVLSLSLVSYTGSGNEDAGTSESDSSSWSGQSFSGNTSDGAAAGDSGHYTVSALGSYSNGSWSLSSYVLQGSSLSTSSSSSSEQDTLATNMMGTVVLQNFSRSDTSASQESNTLYQSGVQAAGAYANVSYNAVYGSAATVTLGTSAPSFSSSDTWQTMQGQTQTLSGGTATESSSLSFQETGESGSGSCYSQTTLAAASPGLLVNLASPDGASVPVAGADASGGGFAASTPDLGVVGVEGAWLAGEGQAAQQEAAPLGVVLCSARGASGPEVAAAPNGGAQGGGVAGEGLPADIKQWWNSLTPQQQESLAKKMQQQGVNLDSPGEVENFLENEMKNPGMNSPTLPHPPAAPPSPPPSVPWYKSADKWLDAHVADPLGELYNNSPLFGGTVDTIDTLARAPINMAKEAVDDPTGVKRIQRTVDRMVLTYNTARAGGENVAGAATLATLLPIADATGVTNINDALNGKELFTNRQLSERERVSKFQLGSIQVVGTAVTIKGMVMPNAAKSLTRLKGMSEAEVRTALEDAGFKQVKVGKSAARNETWKHADGSEVRIHPYGNEKTGPYKSGNNAHIHKEDPVGNQLTDRGIVSNNPDATHIGIKNPPDLPIVRKRPHGEGSK